MGLNERLTERRHQEHLRSGAVDARCPLCKPDPRPEWMRRGSAKDLTAAR